MNLKDNCSRKTHRTILILALSIFFFTACSANKNVKETPPFRVEKTTLAKGIDESGAQDLLISPSSKFSVDDPAIITHVKFANVSGKHKVQWKWYEPSGKLYYQTKNYKIGPSKGYIVDEATTWHKISVKDEKASLYPGNWKVELYFDGDLITSKQFEIEPGKYDVAYNVDNNIPSTSMNNPDAVAVVIGNRNYEHRDIPTVDYAHHDAEIMQRYLTDTLGYKKGNIIFKKDASKTNFEGLFGISGNHKGEVYDYVKPGKSDVFVYYSGHGAPDLDNMKGYFVPTDCDPERVALNGYSLDLLYENLSKLEARNVTVVLEACFSGATNTGIYLTKSASPALIRVDTDKLSTGNISVLTSSDSNQISSWYDEQNHGLFTYFFLKGIGGAADADQDSKITFQEIHDYAADRSEGVPYWAKRLHGGRTQTPMLYSNQSDNVFVSH